MIYQRPSLKPLAGCPVKDCKAGSQATGNCQNGANPAAYCQAGVMPFQPGRCLAGSRAGDICALGGQPCLSK